MNAKLINKANIFKIATQISDNDRIVVSKAEDFDTTNFRLSNDEDYEQPNKPNAFYYAFGEQWIDKAGRRGNVYLIEIDLSKIYQLNENNLKDFILRYCKYISSNIVVNWNKFKKDYYGMEIKNLGRLKSKLKNLTKDTMWFLETVDVDGGFFWNKSVLKSVKKIGNVSGSFYEPEFEEMPESKHYKLENN